MGFGYTMGFFAVAGAGVGQRQYEIRYEVGTNFPHSPTRDKIYNRLLHSNTHNPGSLRGVRAGVAAGIEASISVPLLRRQ